MLTPARALYSGRGFQIAARAAELIGADLGVISAGLGYVTGESEIPAYDLTVRSSGPGSVASRVDGVFDPRAWWLAMQRGPFATTIGPAMTDRRHVLVCLSRAYAVMVIPDLVEFSSRHPHSLRIFGLSITQALPEDLRPFVMPYDARLDVIGMRGTRLDFPQRALRDFVEHVMPVVDALEEQKSMVLKRLSPALPPRPRPQHRADDATVTAHILRLIPTIGVRSSAILRHLRQVDGVSCEQKRFADLFKAATMELAR
ncbi:hypothetical protein KXS07_28990 [Inquilinus limosus]|uniref:hypothetical protein n=1 Tax=Inquilinus limosus TaxID=171674 RepID=UPI003F149F7A